MPVLSQVISETPEHVFRPIIEQLSHRILATLNYDEIIGDRIYIQTDWMTHSETADTNANPELSQEGFRVEANIQMNPTSQKYDVYTFYHTSAYGVGQRLLNNTFPIYTDRRNGVRITEMRSPVTITLNCSLTLKSVELAYQLPYQIFNLYENGSMVTFTDLAFDYPIPKPMLAVLYGLWKLDRDDGQPASIKFFDYLQSHTGNTWQVHTHREHDEYEIVMPSYDLKALATLEYSDDKPTGEMKNRLPVAFTIPFVYTIQFAMPTHLHLEYPSVYNNQLVPFHLIPHDRTQRNNRMPEQHKGIADEHYDRTYGHRYLRCITSPWYDHWVVPNTSRAFSYGHEPIAVLSLLVDEDNPKRHTVIDLKKDFDETFAFKPVVKEILYQQGEESVRFDTIYSVAVYKGDRLLVGGRDYTFNEDLELSFNATDLHAQYRMVVSSAQKLRKISRKWHNLLKKYFKYLNPALKYQIAAMVVNGYRPPVHGSGVVDPNAPGSDGRYPNRPGYRPKPGGGGSYRPTHPNRPGIGWTPGDGNGSSGGAGSGRPPGGYYPNGGSGSGGSGILPGYPGGTRPIRPTNPNVPIWRHPSWPDDITMDSDGNVYDSITGECVGNISDTIEQGGKGYASGTSTRIIDNIIIARKTGEPSS